MNIWTTFLKKYAPRNKYKIWDIDTKIDGILKNLKLKFNEKNIITATEICVVPRRMSENDKTNKSFRYILEVDGKDVTPISRGVDGSSSAIRQYLQIMDVAGIISYPSTTLKGEKITFDVLDASFIKNSTEETILRTGKRILNIGLDNPKSYIKNIWLSLILSMIGKLDKMTLIEIQDEIGYTKLRSNKNEDLVTIIDDIQYTYKTFYDGDIIEYFNKYKDNEILSDYSLRIFGKEISGNDRDKLTSYIFEQVLKRRTEASNAIRAIREYENASDLSGIDVPSNALDCAHIKSVSSIKQDALIESSRKNPNKKIIDKILSQINDQNNLVLIPHNYHYLLDKGYLTISQEGEFIKTKPGNIVYEEFGIKNRVFIKDTVLNHKMREYISIG